MKRINLYIIALAILSMLSFVYRYEREWVKDQLGIRSFSKEIKQVLDLSGENRKELEALLHHYQNESDSLKLKAAGFLIKNMYLHGNPGISMENNLGWELYNFKEFEEQEMENHLDSIRTIHGEVRFESSGWQSDVLLIKADFLIQQIDLAFSVWGKPWNRYVDFEQFCNYILPYRSHYEPIESGWREHYMKKFLPLLDSLTGNDDPVRVATLVNDSLANSLGYRHIRMYFPRELSFTEALQMGGGMCEDLTNQTVYAMRSLGIPVVVDFTPYWPKVNLGHQWVSLVIEDGSTVPFDGTYRNPDRSNLETSRPAAKAFRHYYERQNNPLVQKTMDKKNIPPPMLNQNRKDVTHLYGDMTNIDIPIQKDQKSINDMAFLAVFNMGGWKPIHWGAIKNERVLYNKMGKNIVYLPVSYSQNLVNPVGNPILLDSMENVHIIKPDHSKLQSMELNRFPLWGNGSALKDGRLYSLYYWDDSWVKVGEMQAINGTVIFEDVPSNAVYRLLPEYEPKARIFLYNKGEMIVH